MDQIVFKSVVTLFFLWTLLNLVIFFTVDPDNAPKWMKWSMALWCTLVTVVMVISSIVSIWV